MDRIDLKVAPVERSVGIVVIDLALSLRIFRALDGERQPAIGSKLRASVLLIGRQRMALIELRLISIFGFRPQRNHQRPLKMEAHGRLQAERVARVYLHNSKNCNQSDG